MTADPVLDMSNPQALNAYSYGNNSPVSFSDPAGMGPAGRRPARLHRLGRHQQHEFSD
jgi:hypothetical protein